MKNLRPIITDAFLMNAFSGYVMPSTFTGREYTVILADAMGGIVHKTIHALNLVDARLLAREYALRIQPMGGYRKVVSVHFNQTVKW